MVLKESIEGRYHAETLEQIKESFRFLHEIGFWDFAVKDNQFRMVESFTSEDENDLARRIREMREENKVYLTLKSLYPPQEKG